MRAFSPRLLVFSLFFAVAVIGIAAVTAFSHQERARELQRWQDKLNLIADGKARDINGWVLTQSRALTSLANNPSLQIYFAAMQAAPTGQNLPQGDYVRNQLTVSASTLGFQPTGPSLAQQVKANVPRQSIGGLALIDMHGKLLMATSYMPALEGELTTALTQDTHAFRMVSLPPAADGTARLGFTLPVYAVQADPTPANQIGTLVGIRPLGEDLFALLALQPGADKTLETALVQTEGDGIRYIDAHKTAAHEANNATSAGAFALTHSAALGEKLDYRGTPVLVVGRALPGTPWTLAVKIDRDVALAGSLAWRTRVTVIFLLLLAAIGSSATLLWRSLAGRTAAQQAQATQALAELLAVVTREQPEAILMVDEKEHIRFANRAATAPFGLEARDALGKTLTQLLGNDASALLRPSVQSALSSGDQQKAFLQESNGRHIQCRFVPLDHVPVDGLSKPTPGVLIVEQDVTDVVQERSVRLATLDQLVATLVSLIDQRDPNTAQRSTRIATLAAGIARAMKLDPTSVATTEIAARLMYIGQLHIPTEFLTRMAPLSNEERLTIRTAMASSAQMLSSIAFDGPVIETLRQTQEHMDGSGPLGLKGDAILLPARILAAASTFVGMTATRNYRSAMRYTDAVAKLMQEVDSRFDRSVITAMLHYLDNEGGRALLESSSTKALA